MTLFSSVKSNDRRKSLIALRNRLAKAIDATESGRDIAALSKRLMEVMAQIDALPDPDDREDQVEAMRRRRAK